MVYTSGAIGDFKVVLDPFVEREVRDRDVADRH